METETHIVRPAAEVATKARGTRRRFERILRGNLAAAFAAAGADVTMRQDYGRLYLGARSDVAAAVLPRIFGIGSWSRIEAVSASDLDAIVATGTDVFGPRVRGRTYAVRPRRISSLPFSSQQIAERLGAALNPGARVDLGQPEVTVHVEAGAESCRFFSDRAPGAGGLPVGASGRAVVLLSGGFDSAVAAWRTLRRGVAVDYVFCNLGGGAYERQVLQIARALTVAWGAGQPARLFVADFEPVLAELRRAVDTRLWQVVLKRLMFRVATAIAPTQRAEAIVTGECIGQVSSQTLGNLASIDPAAGLPVLRPLAGFDKQEIIDAAERIGTAAISRHVKEYCAIVPDRPATSSRPGRVAREEANMDPAVLQRAITGSRGIDLLRVTAADLRTPYLFTGSVPAGAAVLDCRPSGQFAAWHLPGAENRDPLALLDEFATLDKDRTYIVVCAHGVQAAGVAELLQQSGFDAYAFAGGIPSLKRYARERAA